MLSRNPLRTQSFRVAIALVGIVILGMAIQLSVIYEQVKSDEDEVSKVLLCRTAGLLLHDTPEELEAKVRDRSTNILQVSLNGAGLFDQNKRYIAGDIHRWPHRLQVSPEVQSMRFRFRDGTISLMHVLVKPVAGPKGQGQRYLVLAKSDLIGRHFSHIVAHMAILSMLPVIICALACAWLISQRILRRVERVYDTIQRIMNGNWQERLTVGRERDGLELISDAINQMLDRLERLMQAVRHVGNDIAHDLRTPLARLQARMDRLDNLSMSPTQKEIERFNGCLERSRADIGQCLTMITALLRIAEIENNRRREGFAVLDAVSLVVNIVDLYEPIAETENVSLTTLIPFQERRIYADLDLLNEVLANLVDNAIKFTPSGGSVCIALGEDVKRRTWIEVRDTGTGIAEEERDAVLGRFYRTDKTRMIPGHGLGLSLVMAIVDLHDAILEINHNVYSQNAKGSIFRVTFPLFRERTARINRDNVSRP
ncbi:HAMP domain-containing sensor histidine kinase [Acetobacteraceae bacterium ESL0709]|nr:HAMP domain-containing sensor histidine kinase [Acetobacteraceae bacterium ESL0697]MDF7678700.1 HAMP domain-containing sensor histidine kinase [Acetobacteraceae bacterium ESL0709]